MFVPTALRASKGGSTVPVPARFVPQKAAAAQSRTFAMPQTVKKKDPDKAYDKFMAEMSNLM